MLSKLERIPLERESEGASKHPGDVSLKPYSVREF